MLHRDELDQVTLDFWTANFQNESVEKNIYKQFSDLRIRMNRDAFNELSRSDTTHIRVYLGLDGANPKLLAVSAYALDATETQSVEYADLFMNNQVYDLCTSTKVNVEIAQGWIQNWYNGNKSKELYKTAFLFPRADFIQLFERDLAQYVQFDFGIEKQIKPTVKGVEVQNPNTNEATGVYDLSTPCPPVCDTYSIIMPNEEE